MDAVPSRFRADVEDGIADAGGSPVKNAIGTRNSACEGVDEDVSVVGPVELDLAPDGRDPYGVAVAADARDDASQELGRARMIRPTKAKRVEARDGPGSHREDVAKDAADSRRRAL